MHEGLDQKNLLVKTWLKLGVHLLFDNVFNV